MCSRHRLLPFEEEVTVGVLDPDPRTVGADPGLLASKVVWVSRLEDSTHEPGSAWLVSSPENRDGRPRMEDIRVWFLVDDLTLVIAGEVTYSAVSNGISRDCGPRLPLALALPASIDREPALDAVEPPYGLEEVDPDVPGRRQDQSAIDGYVRPGLPPRAGEAILEPAFDFLADSKVVLVFAESKLAVDSGVFNLLTSLPTPKPKAVE